MCEVTTALAGASALASVAGTATSAAASSASASATNAANAANYVSTREYNQEVEQDNIDYGTSYLNYEKDAVASQWSWANQAVSTAEQNTKISEGQAVLQSVQQNMADTMQQVQSRAQAMNDRSTAQAGSDARGVQGNSTQELISSVNAKENQDQGIMEINRSAQNQQARINVAAAKASGDAQLSTIQSEYKTYAPTEEVAPEAPTTTSATATGTSALAEGLSIAGTATSYLGSIANSSGGKTTNATLIGNWLGIS